MSALSAYLHGRLAPDAAGEVADHLPACAACRAALGALPDPYATVIGQPPARAFPGPAAGDVLAFGGGYRLVARLGRGAFGEVWRAEAPGGLEVALKIIPGPVDEAAAGRELEALQLVKRLRHPFLLQTHGYATLDDRLLIVMELADGSLADRLRATKDGLSAAELLGPFREAAEALDFLHDHGVQHRDVKPDNLLLVQGHLKVADFGLATVHESRLRTTSHSAGTPLYLAPEVWRGLVSPHTDQYALAVSYAELRLGRCPFPGTNLAQLLLDHAQHQPTLAPLPEAEQVVLLRALAKEAGERYASCTAFVDALAAASAPEPLVSTAEPGIPQRRRFSAVGWLVATVAALLAFVLLLRQPPSPAPETPRASDIDLRTNKADNRFAPGDELVVHLTNRSSSIRWVELYGEDVNGRLARLLPPTPLRPGEERRLPAEGPGWTIGELRGRERLRLAFAAVEFPPGEVRDGSGSAPILVYSDPTPPTTRILDLITD